MFPDPLNSDAASLMLKQPDKFKKKVKEYVQNYAQEKNIDWKEENEKAEAKEDGTDDSKLSDIEIDDDDLKDFQL